MNTFQLKIIASNRIFFDGEATSLVVPHTDGGQMCFLAHHENCVLPIDAGEMKIIDKDDETVHAFVGNGFLECFDNSILLVCVSAEHPDEIDARRAQEAKERAEEEMRQKLSILEHHHSQANLARAMERLKVKSRYL